MPEALIVREESLVKDRPEDYVATHPKQAFLDGVIDRLSGDADDVVRGMIAQYVSDIADAAEDYPLVEEATEEDEDAIVGLVLDKVLDGEGYKTIDEALGGELYIPDDTTLEVFDLIRAGFAEIAQQGSQPEPAI